MEDHQVVDFNLNALSNNVEYNILLIGATAKDKSEFSEAFAKYFKFGSLDEAMAGDGEWDEVTKSSGVSSQNVYTFRQNDKLVRFIDPCMKDTSDEEYIYTRALRQSVADYPKLRAIVLVVKDILEHKDIDLDLYFELNVLPLLLIIPKSACNNVVLCFTRNSTHKISKKLFAKLQSKICRYTTITPHQGRNVLIMDSCVREYLVDRQGRDYSDERINQCRTSWIEVSGQLQTMIDYVASRKPCEMTNVVELWKASQILHLYFETGRKYYFNEYPEKSLAKCLNENPTEYENLEEIILKLWTLVMHLTTICPLVVVKKIVERTNYCKDKSEKLDEFLKKLRQASQNCQSVKVKLSQCSATDYFHELFSQLSKLPLVGPEFADKVTVLSPAELRHVVSILTENNLLLGECAGRAEPEIGNVTFSCAGLPSRTVKLVCKNSPNFLNIKQSDIKFVIDNIDCVIKYNLYHLLPFVSNYRPKEEVNLNQQGGDCFCLIM